MARRRQHLLLFIALCCLLVTAVADVDDDLEPAPELSYTCTRFGICEPCPSNALHQPYCQPYGNRRLLHCVSKNSTHDDDEHGHDEHSVNDGHIPAWESCGRSPTQQRQEYWQFIACNVFFAMVALVVLFARTQVVAAMQARRLAARIGVRWTAGVGAR
ncbi:hypothetical protein EXIGLDRAFT_764941 [Exidia glandulosa HHB12029]|uniref:Uncharacterized protein n=1 Tax=Exidia glandulosa HHB12029 TaxID=1314781 RepID=A0A165KTW8_EXIGL|nr:hypothetical protein EXIGLDRAFT_764941 [Exidia glandulosa HHB12029]